MTSRPSLQHLPRAISFPCSVAPDCKGIEQNGIFFSHAVSDLSSDRYRRKTVADYPDIDTSAAREAADRLSALTAQVRIRAAYLSFADEMN